MRKFIYNLIVKIGIDRIAHFSIGVLITMICILAFSWFGVYPVVTNSIIFSLIIAIVKESFDEKKDVWDIVATMIGSVTMLGMYFFILYVIS